MALANKDNLCHLGLAPALVNELEQQVSPLMVYPANTNLNTVGAGTITAAGIVAGTVTRGGAQSGSGFTDTTATAAQIVTAMSNAAIGQSLYFTYVNNTNASATLAGGTGVTISGITIVPQSTWAEFIVAYTAAATVTLTCIACGPVPHS